MLRIQGHELKCDALLFEKNSTVFELFYFRENQWDFDTDSQVTCGVQESME